MDNLNFEDCRWLDLESEIPGSPNPPDSFEPTRGESMAATINECRAN